MAFNSDNCKIGAEMEFSTHDGTIRDVIFLEDTDILVDQWWCGQLPFACNRLPFWPDGAVIARP
ncbi:hypothetical protein COOONC_26108 [Cooperia oncophora]